MIQQKEAILYTPLAKRALIHCISRSGVHILETTETNGELAEESYQDLISLSL